MSDRNPKLVALISLHSDWTEEQRTYGILASRERALEMLVIYTGVNLGYSIWRWTWHLLRYKHTLVGFRVLWGLYTGDYARHIERTKQHILNHPSNRGYD
jgi:hypothetical protein